MTLTSDAVCESLINELDTHEPYIPTTKFGTLPTEAVAATRTAVPNTEAGETTNEAQVGATSTAAIVTAPKFKVYSVYELSVSRRIKGFGMQTGKRVKVLRWQFLSK